MNKIIRIGKSEYHRNEIPEQKQTESRIQSLPWKLKDLYPNEDIKMERFHNKQLETRFLDNHKNLKKKLRKLILYPERHYKTYLSISNVQGRFLYILQRYRLISVSATSIAIVSATTTVATTTTVVTTTITTTIVAITTTRTFFSRTRY